jgi:hypothetical protein
MELNRIKKLMQCIQKVQIGQTYDFIAPHPRNRAISPAAVELLSLLLSDKDAIFLPIFVVKATKEDIIILDNKKIKYLIVDGQHRFESAKEEGYPYLYIDVTEYFAESGYVDPEKIAKTVDALNIGVRAYDNKTLKKVNQDDAFLSFYNELVEDRYVAVAKRKKVRSGGYNVELREVELSRKCTEEFVIGATKIDKFKKSKYRSGKALTDDEKDKMEKAVSFYKSTIDGMSGYYYDPSYQFRDFTSSFVNKIHFEEDVNREDFYRRWTAYLLDKYSHISFDTKNDIYDELFSIPRNYMGEVFDEFLTTNAEYETEKGKYYRITELLESEMV